MKTAFNNTLYQDRPHLFDEDVFPAQWWWEKIKGGTPEESSEDYLYKDEYADRFNAPNDPRQRHGQPKGLKPDTGPVYDFGSSDMLNDNVFVDDLINTTNIEDEKVIDEIKEKIGGK